MLKVGVLHQHILGEDPGMALESCGEVTQPQASVVPIYSPRRTAVFIRGLVASLLYSPPAAGSARAPARVLLLFFVDPWLSKLRHLAPPCWVGEPGVTLGAQRLKHSLR